MSELKEKLKKYLLVKHTEARLKEVNKHVEKTIPWIWRKGLMNNIQTHCNVLLNSLLNEEEKQTLRTNKYIVDSILKYNVERSETLIKANKKINNMKTFMQLNSYIIFEEIAKGLAEHKKKNAIDFNIRMQLSLAQERINAAFKIEDVLNDRIGAETVSANPELN